MFDFNSSSVYIMEQTYDTCYKVRFDDKINLKDFASALWIPTSEGGASTYRGEEIVDPEQSLKFAPFWKMVSQYTN